MGAQMALLTSTQRQRWLKAAVIDEMRNDEPAVDPAPSRKSESGSGEEIDDPFFSALQRNEPLEGK